MRMPLVLNEYERNTARVVWPISVFMITAITQDWIEGVTTVIAFEQRLLVSLKAWMAKKYSVSGSSPVIVACVSPTA